MKFKDKINEAVMSINPRYSISIVELEEIKMDMSD